MDPSSSLLDSIIHHEAHPPRMTWLTLAQPSLHPSRSLHSASLPLHPSWSLLSAPLEQVAPQRTTSAPSELVAPRGDEFFIYFIIFILIPCNKYRKKGNWKFWKYSQLKLRERSPRLWYCGLDIVHFDIVHLPSFLSVLLCLTYVLRLYHIHACIDQVTCINHITRIICSRHMYRSHRVHRLHHMYHMHRSHRIHTCIDRITCINRIAYTHA